MTYGFIGAGNMAQSMIKVLLAADIAPTDIMVASPRRASELAERFKIRAASNAELVAASDVIILAFLPNQLATIAAPIAEQATGKTIISVLAGVPLADITAAFPGAYAVRSLPNINVAQGLGNTSLAFADGIPEQAKQAAQAFYKTMSATVVLDEDRFAAFSAVAGSAPAYVCRFIAAISDAGIANGLDAETTEQIVTQMVLGSAKTLQESGQTARELAATVASPGGCTEAGLKKADAIAFDRMISQVIDATVHHKHT